MFNVPGQARPIDTDSKWDYLNDIQLSELSADQIEILIGAPTVLIPNEFRRGKNCLPHAVKTPFGWTLFGVFEDDSTSSNMLKINHLKVDEDRRLEELVKGFWKTETFGTKFNSTNSISMNERKLLNKLEEETTFKNGHYEVPCFGRIKTDKTWYLPHHAVTNINKPGKVRMVFDAAAKSFRQSLNSNLYSGRDLVNNLIGVLLQFRKHRVAITADIEGIFDE